MNNSELSREPVGRQFSNHPDLFAWMDVWRFIAALLVVVSHARDVAMQPYGGEVIFAPFYALTGFGHSAVILFFVLSGFWISRSALSRIDAPDFYQQFMLDRLTRLMIVLVPALALGGAIDWIGLRWLDLPIYSGETGVLSLPADASARLDWVVALGNLAFLQTIAVPAFGTNGPLWSLAWEFWFYLWFAAGAVLLLRRRITFALLSLLVAYFNIGIMWGFVAWLMGFGLLIAVENKRAEHDVRGLRLPLTGLLFFAVFILVLFVSRRAESQFFDILLAASFAALLFATQRCNIPFPAVLEPVARYGRNASFSLYVVHFPVVVLVGGWLLGKERLPPGLYGVCVTLVLSGVCLLAAWIFSLATERNTGVLRSRLKAFLS